MDANYKSFKLSFKLTLQRQRVENKTKKKFKKTCEKSSNVRNVQFLWVCNQSKTLYFLLRAISHTYRLNTNNIYICMYSETQHAFTHSCRQPLGAATFFNYYFMHTRIHTCVGIVSRPACLSNSAVPTKTFIHLHQLDIKF